jgi:Uma2 family endonuclease
MTTAETTFRSEETFTQKEFRRWVEKLPASDIHHYELIDGRIVMTPPAKWGHAEIEAAIVHLLREHVMNEGLGVALGSSAGYELPTGDTLEPDASYVSNERLSKGPRPRPDEFPRVVPSLVVEVISPSTARRDRTEKKEIYERSGVDEYWLVDPGRKEVIVFYRGEGAYGPGHTVRKGAIRSRVLPKLKITVEKLFAG